MDNSFQDRYNSQHNTDVDEELKICETFMIGLFLPYRKYPYIFPGGFTGTHNGTKKGHNALLH